MVVGVLGFSGPNCRVYVCIGYTSQGVDLYVIYITEGEGLRL